MGRQYTGPILIRGIFYARLSWRDDNGKQHQAKESLKTSNRTTALNRWPAAMERLRAKAAGEAVVAAPIKPDDLVWSTNDAGQPVKVVASTVVDDSAFELDWESSWAIHAARKEARTGRALAESTLRSARNAWKGLGISHPALVTAADVRDYEVRLQEGGYKATSITQRMGLLGGIITSLQKKGWLDREKPNPFHLIDTESKTTVHHRAATEEELNRLLSELTGDVLLAVKLQIYLGLRIGEVTSREPQHLENGWLTINETDKWRPKSKHSERVLPVPGWCRELPQRFPQRTSINRWIKQATGSDDLSSHGLRGAWRTATREAGISTEMAEHLIGHSQPTELIDTYGEFSPAAKRDAMEKVWAVIDGWCAETNDND